MRNEKIEDLIILTFAKDKMLTYKKKEELREKAQTMGIDANEFNSAYRATIKTLKDGGKIRTCPKCGAYVDAETYKCPRCEYDIEKASLTDALRVAVAGLNMSNIQICAIPETQEQLVEFLSVLNSSIEIDKGTNEEAERVASLRNKSCLSKLMEVIQKAENLFPGDSQLNSLIEKSKEITIKTYWDNIDACPLPLTKDDLNYYFSFLIPKIKLGSKDDIQVSYRESLLVCIQKTESLFPEDTQLNNMANKAKDILKQHNKKKTYKKIILIAVPVVIILLIILLCKSCS